MGLRRIEELRRMRDATRRVRESLARRSSVDHLARKLPPLLEWIPSVSPQLRSPKHFARVVRRLERIARGERIELAFSCPPRHGKSTLVQHLIVWLLIQRPDLTILYCMHSANMAKDMTESMRAIARRAGLALGKKQTQRIWTTAAGGSVTACGVKNPPTGAGFDIVVVDDPHANEQAAKSPAQRARVIRSYQADLLTREVIGGASHILVHTRWDLDDLIGVMTAPADPDDENAPEPFEYINLPALDEDDEALAPWMFSAARLKKKRARDPVGFESLYQGDPAPRGGGHMGPPVWVDADAVPDAVVHAGGVDLARTVSERSDHFASVIYARDPSDDDEIVYVVDIEHEKEPLTDKEDPETHELEQPGFIRRVHRQQREFDGCALRMYTGREESSVLALYGQHREFPTDVTAIRASSSKLERAEAFIAAWNAGKIRLVRGTRNSQALAAQVRVFTGKKGGIDDLVDAAVAGFDEVMTAVKYTPRKKPRAPSPRRSIASWASQSRPHLRAMT